MMLKTAEVFRALWHVSCMYTHTCIHGYYTVYVSTISDMHGVCVMMVPLRPDTALLSHQAAFQVLQCELLFHSLLSPVPVC